MKHGVRWDTWMAILGFLVMLGTTAAGCYYPNPTATPWEATGVQVTRLELPLGGDGQSFKVGEFILEGREGSGASERQFHDRALLIIHPFRGPDGEVSGYLRRTYASGGRRALRLLGTIERVAGNPETLIAGGRVYTVESGSGGTRPFAWIGSFELHLDPATGRLSARGSRP